MRRGSIGTFLRSDGLPNRPTVLVCLVVARSAELLLREISARLAVTVSKWQALGFTHGVLNTDNMSLLGLTLDYGPYGFMEGFDEDFIPNARFGGGLMRC